MTALGLPRTEMPEGVEVESAHLVGEFNDWNPTTTAMKYSKKKKAFWVAESHHASSQR